MTDFILSGAKMAGLAGPVDIGVAKGLITAIAPSLPGNTRVEALGGWVFPGYVDAHIHLDKAHILERCDMTRGGLAHAVRKPPGPAGFTTRMCIAAPARCVRCPVGHAPWRSAGSWRRPGGRPGAGSDGCWRCARTAATRSPSRSALRAGRHHQTKPETPDACLSRAMEMGADLVGGCPYRRTPIRSPISSMSSTGPAVRLRRGFPHRLRPRPENLGPCPPLIAATEARGWAVGVRRGATPASCRPVAPGRPSATHGGAVCATRASDVVAPLLRHRPVS